MPKPDLRVIEPRPAAGVRSRLAELKAEAAEAVEDALLHAEEAARRAFEVVGACPAEMIGVGRAARLQRLAAFIALEVRQVRELPAP